MGLDLFTLSPVKSTIFVYYHPKDALSKRINCGPASSTTGKARSWARIYCDRQRNRGHQRGMLKV
jgi:hypothetical protein